MILLKRVNSRRESRQASKRDSIHLKLREEVYNPNSQFRHFISLTKEILGLPAPEYEAESVEETATMQHKRHITSCEETGIYLHGNP